MTSGIKPFFIRFIVIIASAGCSPFLSSYVVWPQYFVIDIGTVTSLGTREDGEFSMAREFSLAKDLYSWTQNNVHQWPEHKTKVCLSSIHRGAHFSQTHPPQNQLLHLCFLTDLWSIQGFAALLCYCLRRQQEDAKCFSGPTVVLKHFNLFWAWGGMETSFKRLCKQGF